MNKFTRGLIVFLSITSSASAFAWDRDYHGHYHQDRGYHGGHHGDGAALLVGGVILGAAISELASSPRTTTYSSTTYYPTHYYESTTYRSEERYYPDTYTTYSRSYPSRVTVRYSEPTRVYSPDVLRDERGDCYEVTYRDGRRILREIASYNCRKY